MKESNKNKCSKVKFGTELEAMFAVEKAIKSKNNKRKEIRYYSCIDCGGYHLTSQRKHQDIR